MSGRVFDGHGLHDHEVEHGAQSADGPSPVPVSFDSESLSPVMR